MLGFKVWFQNRCGLGQCFPSVFEVIAKFPRQKSGSILPYFRGRNLVALRLKYVIAYQTLFLPSFQREITTMGMSHFHGEIRQNFVFGALWWTNRVSHLCIRCVSTYSHRDEPKPFKVLSMLMHVTYMGKPMSLGDMDQDNHTTMIVHTI